MIKFLFSQFHSCSFGSWNISSFSVLSGSVISEFYSIIGPLLRTITDFISSSSWFSRVGTTRFCVLSIFSFESTWFIERDAIRLARDLRKSERIIFCFESLICLSRFPNFCLRFPQNYWQKEYSENEFDRCELAICLIRGPNIILTLDRNQSSFAHLGLIITKVS